MGANCAPFLIASIPAELVCIDLFQFFPVGREEFVDWPVMTHKKYKKCPADFVGASSAYQVPSGSSTI